MLTKSLTQNVEGRIRQMLKNLADRVECDPMFRAQYSSAVQTWYSSVGSTDKIGFEQQQQKQDQQLQLQNVCSNSEAQLAREWLEYQKQFSDIQNEMSDE